jgi:hypothetical protein
MLLFYLLNVYSVYFCSQLLQMSPLISSDSHNRIDLIGVVYGSVIAVGISLSVYQLTKIPDQHIGSYKQAIYIGISHLSAIIFALMGEIPFLHGFALTPGCWERLPFRGKIVIFCAAVAITMLVVYQLARSLKQKKICREVLPVVLISTSWFIVWLCVITQDTVYYTHVHHALFGSFFACLFWDFTSMVDIVANAIFMGIVIEGIDFFGISELHLFIIHNNFPVHMFGIVVVWCVVVVFQCVVVKYTRPLKPLSKSALEMPFIGNEL